MTRVHVCVRWLLLGDDASWGATFATGRLAIYGLAAFALLTHVLDVASGLQMMLVHGIYLEQNPLARFIMDTAGPIGLVGIKVGVVLAGIILFVRTAHVGRRRLARNCLLVAAGIGMLGWTSNLVG